MPGDLHVRGNFDVAAHGIVVLRVRGDLVVDGAYRDRDYPRTIVVIDGDLRANVILTGADLRVRGEVKARHLAGDYNDYGATFHRAVSAVTFIPETHYFTFKKVPRFELVIGDAAPHRVSPNVAKHVRPVPDAALEGYLRPGLVAGGNLARERLEKLLAANEEILAAEPSAISPELAALPAAVRAKLAKPAAVTSLSLSARELTALPAPLLACTNLTSLNLADNPLTSLAGIGRFAKLTKLDLDGTELAALPAEMQKLSHLKSLGLRYTPKLTALPAWFARLGALEELWLTASALDEVPRVLAKLPKLRKLWLWHLFDVPAKRLAELIALAGELPHLTHVGLFQGRVAKLPADLSPLAKIENVHVADVELPKAELARLRRTVAVDETHVERR